MAHLNRQTPMRNSTAVTDPGTPQSKTATSGLLSLQSTAERSLLDAIDQARSYDVNHELDLPQLVVCGSQSSGKSSTLEGFSGYSFPRGESTCTRFVTEIQFRRNPVRSVEVSIIDKTNTRQHAGAEAITWSKTERDLDPKDLPRLIEEAKVRMGISNNNSSFSRDILRVQISGPDHCPLTLVDLPGIIESHSKNKGNIDLIKSVVDEWITQKRSIILIVIDARNDAETQGILTRAREVDPHGERTFGIITKPDLALPNSKQERYWIRHAQNLPPSMVEFGFKKGWHVLLNRGFQEVERETSSKDRDDKEYRFFTDSSKNWHEVDPAYWGVEALRRRLSRLLYEHTQTQLPQVRRDILAKLEEKYAHLERLEDKTKKPERIWTDFQRGRMSLLRLVTVGVDGKYNDAFFSDIHGSPALYLRSRLEEQYEDFQREMIEESSDITMPSKDGTLPLDNSHLVEEVTKVMRETRGEELPGHFDPQRLDLLFWRHSNSWNSIASKHLDIAHQHCVQFLDEVIHSHLQDQVPGLPKQVGSTIVADIRKSLKKLKSNAKVELQKLEADRRRSTKTLNHTFLRISQENKHKKLQRMFNRAQHVEANTPSDPNTRKPRMTPSYISKIAGQEDLATENAETVAEDMLAFLRVSREVFIDNVVIQVIERHLLADLHSLFCGDFGIDETTFRSMLQDADYQAIEHEKQALEGEIQSLQACYDALR